MTESDPKVVKQGQTSDAEHAAASPVRKPYVEPVISSPVDVLEATTYLQVVDSGVTNPTGKPQ